MTLEEAEQVWMAWQVGFESNTAKIAEAILVIKANDQRTSREEQKPEFDL